MYLNFACVRHVSFCKGSFRTCISTQLAESQQTHSVKYWAPFIDCHIVGNDDCGDDERLPGSDDENTGSGAVGSGIDTVKNSGRRFDDENDNNNDDDTGIVYDSGAGGNNNNDMRRSQTPSEKPC